MAEIYLVRHFETASNVKGLFGDGPLDDLPTDRGVAQARALCKVFLNRRLWFDICYCGTSLRQKNTAGIICPIGVPRKEHGALNEKTLGAWGGKSKEAIDPELLQRWRKGEYVPEGGETQEDFESRVSEFWEEVIVPSLSKCIRILVVTSGNPIRIFVAHTLGIPWVKLLPELDCDNCAISMIRRNDRGFFVATINDTSHLASVGVSALPGT